jgi:hypothetical protein
MDYGLEVMAESVPGAGVEVMMPLVVVIIQAGLAAWGFLVNLPVPAMQ